MTLVHFSVFGLAQLYLTCFESTRVQMLTQKALLARVIFGWATLYKGPPPPFFYFLILFFCVQTQGSPPRCGATLFGMEFIFSRCTKFEIASLHRPPPPPLPHISCRRWAPDLRQVMAV